MQPWLHKTKKTLQNKLIKSENSTQYTRWFFFCGLHPVFYKRNVKKVLFLHNWLKINTWHYLHLPKNTAQPSAPSPEVVGQAMKRKIPGVKYVVDWNSQEFKQLILGNQSIIFHLLFHIILWSNYIMNNIILFNIILLLHISLLQLNQGLLFYCFY